MASLIAPLIASLIASHAGVEVELTPLSSAEATLAPPSPSKVHCLPS
jgi:hypothetical protein